jgi:hypothetical protein
MPQAASWRSAVRRHPVAAFGGALVAGLLIAAMAR